MISSVSVSSGGDFCFAVEVGVATCCLRSSAVQLLSCGLSSASEKCCYFNIPVTANVTCSLDLKSSQLHDLRSKISPRKGCYFFSRGINPELTSKKNVDVSLTNCRVCITSQLRIFLEKRAMVFQKKLRE